MPTDTQTHTRKTISAALHLPPFSYWGSLAVVGRMMATSDASQVTAGAIETVLGQPKSHRSRDTRKASQRWAIPRRENASASRKQAEALEQNNKVAADPKSTREPTYAI